MPLIHPATFIGNENSSSLSGTIGCFGVLRSDPAVKVLVSNQHVIFNGNASPPLRIGSPDAGSCRCCCPKNIVARATSAGVIGDSAGTYLDCAIARLEPGVTGLNQIADLNLANGLGGFLKGPATVVDDDRVFVCTNSEVLRRRGGSRIIPCRVLHDSVELHITGAFGETHTENRQIQLKVDARFEVTEEEGSGDSGSIVVDLQNRVVGLLHSRGSQAAIPSNFRLDLIIACPINAVMDALQINIPSESASTPHSGLLLEDVPLQEAPGITDPELLRFQRLVKQSATGLLFHDLGFRHGPEVVQLVHHCRPVTVAWHRSEGPAWAAHLINSARDASYRVPADVKGITQKMVLDSMAETLSMHGSDALRRDLQTHAPNVIALAGLASVADLLQRLGVSDEDQYVLARESPAEKL